MTLFPPFHSAQDGRQPRLLVFGILIAIVAVIAPVFAQQRTSDAPIRTGEQAATLRPIPPVVSASRIDAKAASTRKSPSAKKAGGTNTVQGTGGGGDRIQYVHDLSIVKNGDYSLAAVIEDEMDCFIGGTMVQRLQATGAGNNYDKTWTNSLNWQAKSLITVTFFTGPSESMTFTRSYSYSDGASCSGSDSDTDPGATDAMKTPTGLSATNGTSDKYVTLTWTKATQHPDNLHRYYIYQVVGGIEQYLGEVLGTNGSGGTYTYTHATTPGTTNSYRVKTRSDINGKVSTPASITGSTRAFDVPTNVLASDDTYAGYVHVTWSGTSAYANRYRIYRDGLLIATLADTARAYDDTDIEDNQTYAYTVRAYSTVGPDSSAASVADNGRAFPVLPMASDGGFYNRVKISWSNLSSVADEIKLFRDGEELGVISSSANAFYDYDAVPGRISRYGVAPVVGGVTYLPAQEYGYIRPKGKIEGHVQTRTLAGIDSVDVSAFPTPDTIRHALAFDADDDNMSVLRRGGHGSTDSMTVEFWMNKDVTGTTDDYIIDKYDSGSGFRLWVNGATLHFQANAGTTSHAVLNSGWHHVAVVVTPVLYRVLVDGVQVASQAGSWAWTDIAGQLVVGNQRGSFVNGFGGALDDIRIWRTARTDVEIRSAMHQQLNGSEQGLVAYWPLQHSAARNDIAGDYALGQGFHARISGAVRATSMPDIRPRALTDASGFYSIRDLYFGETGDFAVKPFKARHGFKPDSLNRSVDINTPVVTSVNFTDTTAFGIEGHVKFAPIAGSMDSCAVEGVEIWLDGRATGIVTDADGSFAISVPDAGVYTVSVKYYDHTFSPSSMKLAVTDNVSGLRFTDMKTRQLTVNLRGGSEHCNIPIGGGTITVQALGTGTSQSPAACLAINNALIAANGDYTLVLPAQRYKVIVDPDYIDAGVSSAPMEQLVDFVRERNVVSVNTSVTPPDTLFVASDVARKFQFRARPVMTVDGFPDPLGCNPPQLVLGQFEKYLMRVELNESYNYRDPSNPDVCPVDSGVVLVNFTYSAGNQITDTLRIINGVGYHLTVANAFSSADVRAVVLNAEGTVFAGANGGDAIYSSSDKGRNWTGVGLELANKAVRAMAVRSDGALFAGTAGGGVYRSTNKGANWDPYNFGFDDANIRSIATDDSILFAGTSTGVYAFRKTGDVWRKSVTGMTNADVNAVLFAGGRLYAATAGGVFSSDDSGGTWAHLSNVLGGTATHALVRNAAGDLYAGTDNGVYRLPTGSSTWVLVATGLPSARVTALAVHVNGDLYAGTAGSGIYRSANAGASWIGVNTGLPNLQVSAIATDASGRLYAGTRGSGVYMSTNNGLRWLDASIKGYTLEPGVPNITGGGAHPYQKRYEFTAFTTTHTVQESFWAVVVGNRQRSPLFVTKTPELPLLILRDPPGDGSSSFWEKGKKIAQSYSMKTEYEGAGGLYADVHIGIGADVPYIGKTGASVHVVGKAGVGGGRATDNTVTVEWEAKERISTADDVLGVSTGGDVFMGAAMNVVFSKTDVIDYDTTNCAVLPSESITWGTQGFATTYVYTETHIRNVLIPLITNLRDVALTDSARISLQNDLDVWNQTLALNDSLKRVATFKRNISFSAGAPYTAEETMTTDSVSTINCKIWVEAEAALALRIYAGAANEKEFGIWGNFQWLTGRDTVTTNSESVSTGYTLNDDDVGDYYSVNIKEDPVYKTPVFDLVAGASSCPYEPGSTPREDPTISIDPTIAFDIPPDEAATFTLTIGNQSQTDEARYYNLYVTQTSNTEGAIIRVGGVVLEDYLQYYVEPGQSVKATVTVERGPIAYDYNNLEFWITSFCDDWQISGTQRFSVHFLNQCSKSTIVEPANNWLVNQSNNDKLKIVLTDLEKDKIGDGIRLEYRKIGTSKNWIEAKFIPKNEVVDQKFALFETEWDIPSNVTDGTYELRVRVNCTTQLGGGTTYSNVVTGTINRTALALFGTPEPRDGILNFGDQIAVVFSNDLDCAEISVAKNIELMFLDDSTIVPVDSIRFDCKGNTLVIMPEISLRRMQNRMIQATVYGLIDINGNPLIAPVVWSFRVNQNSLIWETANATATTFEGAGTSVTGTLRNVGGKMETFVLGPTREWLVPITTTGTLPPAGTQDVRFVISDKLNPGTYHDTVYAHTGDGDEPFYIEVRVLHRPPQWTIDPSRYQHNMEITAQFLIDTVFSTDANDMVAAFVGNECRGIATMQYVPSLDAYRAFLSVYGDGRSTETVRFRVWDASKGRVHHMIETFVFDQTASHGTLLSPVILHPSATEQSIMLDKGWNWISLNTRGTNMTPNAVMANTPASVGDVLKGQTDYSQYAGGSGWVGSVDSMRIGRAYKLYMASESSLRLVGTQVPATTPLPVSNGWNWIGYLPVRMTGVNQALATLSAATGDRIKGRNGFAQFNGIGGWQGSLGTLTPNQGYLLKLGTAGTLTYPDVDGFWPGRRGGNQLASFDAGAGAAVAAPEWTVDPTRFEHTMNVTSSIVIDATVSNHAQDLLAVFVGDECRGVARPVEVDGRILHFLTAYANTENEALSFRIYSAEHDSVLTATQSLSFTADAVYGDPLTPYDVRVQTTVTTVESAVPTSLVLEQNYPNPFNPSTTISFQLPVAGHVSLKVFDVLGNQVAVLLDGKLGAGRHSLPFDASGLQSGHYSYQLTVGAVTETRKMLLVK